MADPKQEPNVDSAGEQMPSLDLGLVADEFEKRRGTWAEAGFTVGELTFRDLAGRWPYRLATREDAVSPDSVGIRVVRGPIEFAVVVFAGGWADVEGADFDNPDASVEVSAPELADAAAVGALLDATFERWAK